MKFDTAPVSGPRDPHKIGNLYRAKGGPKTAFWLLCAITPSGASGHFLGLADSGEIVSTATYGFHAMETREIVGTVPAIANMKFKITPKPESAE